MTKVELVVIIGIFIIMTGFVVVFLFPKSGILEPVDCSYYKNYSILSVPARCIRYFEQGR